MKSNFRLRVPDMKNIEPLRDREIDFLVKLIYHPITNIVYQKRYQMALDLIEGNSDKILENRIWGVLLPSLALKCSQLYAVDIHDKIAPVQRMVKKEGVQAELRVGNIMDLLFADSYFGLITCLSVFEHLKPVELPIAMKEIDRVLKEDGHLILGFPVKNKLTHMLFKLVGFDDQKGHPSRHSDILRNVRSNFVIKELLKYPSFLEVDYCLYLTIKSDRKETL